VAGNSGDADPNKMRAMSLVSVVKALMCRYSFSVTHAVKKKMEIRDEMKISIDNLTFRPCTDFHLKFVIFGSVLHSTDFDLPDRAVRQEFQAWGGGARNERNFISSARCEAQLLRSFIFQSTLRYYYHCCRDLHINNTLAEAVFPQETLSRQSVSSSDFLEF
jgi:hypothetical protein